MKNVAIYVRVSTQEQKKHGLSVDNQIDALTEYCHANGFNIAGIFNDAGISARKSYTKRPALCALLEECKNGNIDLIIFTKLDRYFRSVADYYAVQTILDKYRVPWRAIWEDYETETSAGVFKVNIMLSVAQSEADRTSERIKSVFDYKKANGDYVGKAPVGYKIQRGQLVKDETTQEAINAFFSEYLRKYSIRDAMAGAYAHGVNIERIHALRLIKNPAYAGECANGYKCPAYITQDQRAEILRAFECKPRSPKNAKRVYMFSGLCFCGYCGRRMSSKTVIRTLADGRRAEHKKYICEYVTSANPCPNNEITEKMLENFLFENVENALKSRIIDVKKTNSRINGNETARKNAIEAKLNRLATLYTDGDISIEAYREKRDALKAELNALVINAVPIPQELPTEWREIYNQLDAEHKRTFWVKIIKKITVTADNKHTIKIDI